MGLRLGQAGEVVFVSDMCTKAPKVQICPKTFVHDWSFPVWCSAILYIRHLKQQTSPARRRQPETWHCFRDVTAHVQHVETWRCPEVENVRTWGFTSLWEREYLIFCFDPFLAYFSVILVRNQKKIWIMIACMLKIMFWKYSWTSSLTENCRMSNQPSAMRLLSFNLMPLSTA